MDLVRYVTGANAQAVYCTAFGSSRARHWPFPSVNAHFTMAEGLHVDFSASWAYDEFRTPWEGVWRLYGTRGALSWDRDRIVVQRSGQSRTVEVPSRDSDHTLGATLEEFTDALKAGRSPVTDIHDNMETVAMVFAAIESSRCGLPVKLADFVRGL